MTPAGWIFMIVSWTAILGFFAFCLSRTLCGPKQESPKKSPPSESS